MRSRRLQARRRQRGRRRTALRRRAAGTRTEAPERRARCRRAPRQSPEAPASSRGRRRHRPRSARAGHLVASMCHVSSLPPLAFLGHRGVSRRRGFAPSAPTLRPLRQTRNACRAAAGGPALSVFAPRPVSAIPDDAGVPADVLRVPQTRAMQDACSVTLNRCANSARDNEVLTRVNDVDLCIR